MCRSLAFWRTNILDPYILPPLQQSISYTHSIAEPYIAQTQVHLEPYAAPVVRTAKTLKPYAVRTINVVQRVWYNTLVPFYSNTLKPYWDTIIVPRYRQHIRPHLVPLGHRAKRLWRYYIVNPVRIQFLRLVGYVEAPYEAHVRPYIAQIKPYAEKAFSLLRAAAIRTWKLYLAHVHPRLVAWWAQARPVLLKAWRQARKATYKYVRRATKEAGALRRTYVDPHVKKIWDKVATPSPSSVPTDSSAITFDSATILPSTVSDEPASSTVEPTLTESEEPKVSILVPIDAYAEENHEPSTSAVTSTQVAEGAAPTVSILHTISAYTPNEESSDQTANVQAGSEEAPKAEIEIPDVEVAVTPEEVVIATTAVEPIVVAAAETIAASNIEEDDLDDFLRDLGVDSTTITASSEPTQSVSIGIQQQSSPPKPQATEDIAAKRAEIVKRHEKWFVEVDKAVAEETKLLPQKLLAFREDKAKELEAMKEKGVIDEVQKEGEKLVKGAEAYLKKAEKRRSEWKVAQDAEVDEAEKENKKKIADGEKGKWNTVLGKIEEKFNEKVQALQQDVHLWYRNVKGGETQIVSIEPLSLCSKLI